MTGLRVSAACVLMVALSMTTYETCAGARDAGHRTKENYIAEKVKQMTELNYRRPLIRLKIRESWIRKVPIPC